ncbi:hypothetical protein [Streptomyces sp. AS02]|uniref:hypothetical protein n=1 Tax=Streptomyces sp. AS02 TaxID=2938946 RepID=UPI002021E569|nr:hypothetical protein [Streptomyces sp. AS02]MCL8015897.1 hypothetical protein [Streptomyces sp. AS02]
MTESSLRSLSRRTASVRSQFRSAIGRRLQLDRKPLELYRDLLAPAATADTRS